MLFRRLPCSGLQYDTLHHVPCSAIRRHGICSAPGRETPSVLCCNSGDVLRYQRAARFWLEKAEWPQCHLGSLKWKQTSSFVKQTSDAYYAYAFHNWSVHLRNLPDRLWGPPSPYRMSTMGLSQGVKRLGRQANHSPQLVPRSRKFGSIIHSPISFHGVVLN
jgi:hypothetical protein